MSEKNFSETRAEPVHKLQKIAGAGRVPEMPSTQSQPSRPSIPTSLPSGAQGATLVIPLIIPSQTQPDPSDLPEHIDRYSPCSMLEEERKRHFVPTKTANHSQRPQVSIIIPEALYPDPSDDPEQRDQLSPGSLLK